MSTEVLPDIVALVIDHLLSTSEVTDLVAGGIHDETPGDVATPYLTVQRIAGGSKVRHWLDEALIQLDAYADDRDTAFDTCAAAAAAMHDLPGEHSLGEVKSVKDMIGTRRLADPAAHRHRFEAELLVTVHPPAAAS